MNKKYFDKVPRHIAGLIFILGSMLDAVAITSVLNQETILAVVFIGLRAGITEFRRLYEESTTKTITP